MELVIIDIIIYKKTILPEKLCIRKQIDNVCLCQNLLKCNLFTFKI